MVINTNVGAVRAMRALSESSGRMNTALARLASGSKIVSPADDAQINRNKAVQNNLTSALSFSQTQDGFLQKVGKALDRMGELAMLADDDTKSTSETDYNTEFADLKNYISDIGTKDFNGVSLFNGEDLFVTMDSDGNVWELNDSDLNDEDIDEVIESDFTAGSWNAVTVIKSAIEDVATHRAQIGANIQRIQFTREQVGLLNENLQASVSRIKDVDVAEESTQFSRYNILVQSGTAMLAQANLLSQHTLRLITYYLWNRNEPTNKKKEY